METRINARKRIAIILAMLMCMATLCGCSEINIKEDSINEQLPQIDPEEGVSKDLNVALYYRLTNENYLVSIKRNVRVRANERAENAIIRTLLEGVPPLSNNVSMPFASGISIVNVSLDGDILYITLSADFLDETKLTEVTDEAQIALDKGTINQDEYDNMVAEAQDELKTQRRLGVYSIINAITGYSTSVRVQFLVDVDGSGTGVRLERTTLGMPVQTDAGSNLLEPMGFYQEIIADPARILDCMLRHMESGEYEAAYMLFAEGANDGTHKPTFANFEAQMRAIGTITSHEIISSSVDADSGINNINVTLRLQLENEREETVNCEMQMIRDGDIYKVCYDAFRDILEGLL
ncbi:MAG: GerMN domain-containing protein [Clostridia bacterium]